MPRPKMIARMTFRLPEELEADVLQEAERRSCSANEVIVTALDRSRGSRRSSATTPGGSAMTPQMQCDRCYRLGPVTFDEEQGELCVECLNHFTQQRATETAEKEEEYDRAPYYPQDY